VEAHRGCEDLLRRLAGSCAESRRPRMALLARNCRRCLVPSWSGDAGANERKGNRSRDQYTSLIEGWRRRRKRLSQGACKKKLPKVEVGGCSRDDWRLRCDGWKRYLLISYYWMTTLRPGTLSGCTVVLLYWGTVGYDVCEYWRVVRHYPLAGVRITATIQQLHRLSS
jgi:hypothetical protein